MFCTFTGNRRGARSQSTWTQKEVCADQKPKGEAQIGVNVEPTNWLNDKKSGGPNLAGHYQRVGRPPLPQASTEFTLTTTYSTCWRVCDGVLLMFHSKFVQPTQML